MTFVFKMMIEMENIKAPIAEAGETWYNPDLAATYEHIATHGAQDFYDG